MRTRQNSGQRDEDRRDAAVPALPPAVDHVLALQRTAGNAAVANVLARYDEVPTGVIDVDSDSEDDDESDFEDEDDEQEVVPVTAPVSTTPRRSAEEQREYDKGLVASGYEVQPTAPVTEEPKAVPVEAKQEKKERKRAEKQAETDKIERAKQRREAAARRSEVRRGRGGMGPTLEPWEDANESRSEKRQTLEIEKLERRIAETRAWLTRVPARFKDQQLKIKAQLDALIKERDARKAEKERLRAARDAPPPRPYAFIVKGVEERYIDEEETTEMFIGGAIGFHLADDKKRHGVAEMDDREALKHLYGWSEDDCVKHYDNANKGQDAKEAKTEQLRTEEQRKRYFLKLSAKIEQDGEPFDTARSTSKAAGPGFAIFVMSETGRFYAGSHKVGLFHHSSLLGSEDAACGGEMKATAGTLEHITNKSGHYTPDPVYLRQALGELARGGVKLAGVKATVWDKAKGGKIRKRVIDAADYMRHGDESKVLDEWVED